MSRSGLAGPPMDNHMDMSHLQMPKHMTVPPQEEPSDLEELEQFAKAFKQRRIKLGFTQVREGRSSKLSSWKLLFDLQSKQLYFKLKDKSFLYYKYITWQGYVYWYFILYFILVSMCSVCRGTWAWRWENSMVMTSARQPSPASRLSTSASKTCANSNLCWRNGWVMQVGLPSQHTYIYKTWENPNKIILLFF